MTRLLDWLIRLLLVLLLLPVSYSFLRESARFVLAIPDGAPFIWAGVGAAAGFLTIILAVIQGDLAGLLGYFRRSVTQSPTYYRIEFDLLRRLWSALLSLSKQFLP